MSRFLSAVCLAQVVFLLSVFCGFAGAQGIELAPADGESLDATTPRVANLPKEENVETPAEQEVESPSDAAPLAAEREIDVELREEIRRCLTVYFEKRLNTRDRSPWAIMHSLISYGVETDVDMGAPGGQRVNAIGWLCYNQPSAGQQIFYLSNGKMQTRQGPGVEGHKGQFLAMLAQSKVKTDYPIRIENREFTVADLIDYEKRTCEPRSELTFKLIALSHYLDSNATWQSERGENWDIPRLISEELAQPIVGAACGGTHRMTGFSYAVRNRVKQGGEVEGEWLRAQKYVDSYIEYTYKLQNPDGSFSTNWFEGMGPTGTKDRKIQTTGHILEWLVYSLPEEDLTDPRVVKAVRFISGTMLANENHSWEIGPRGHALHALAIYDERVFGSRPGSRKYLIATRQSGE